MCLPFFDGVVGLIRKKALAALGLKKLRRGAGFAHVAKFEKKSAIYLKTD